MLSSHLDYDEKVFAVFALDDNALSVLELHGLERVGHGQPLPLVERLEYGHFGEKLLVHVALAYGAAHENAPVGVAIDGPQLDVGLGAHGGGAQLAVDERQLAKAAAVRDGRDQVVVDVDADLARVDDVEVVALVALLDDRLAGAVNDRKHGVEYVAALVVVQVHEEHVLRNGLGQRRHCLVVFGHNLFN